MKSCVGRTDLANWAWAVHKSVMTLPMHLGYLDLESMAPDVQKNFCCFATTK